MSLLEKVQLTEIVELDKHILNEAINFKYDEKQKENPEEGKILHWLNLN